MVGFHNVKTCRPISSTILGLALATICLTAPATAVVLTIEAGDVDREPLVVEVACTPKQFTGTDAADAKRVPVIVRLIDRDNKQARPLIGQWTANGSAHPEPDTGTLVFQTRARLAAGSTRTFEVETVGADNAPPDRIVARVDPGNAVIIQRSGKPVLQYYIGIQRCPDRSMPNMDRTAYAHPLWSPAGKIVTGDFSPDHIHQRGLFIAWRQFKWGDRASDFWSLAKGQGIIRHVGLEDLRSGPVFAEFAAKNLGLLPNDDGTEDKVLAEVWHTRVYDIGDDAYMYDVRIRHDALEKNLELPKYHYGGFAYRGARIWEKTEPTILTSEGKSRDGDGQPARWCRFGGTIDGGQASITIFDHAANPRYPKQLLRIHPTMPYYCFPINKSGPYVIKVGRPLHLRYRVYVADGHPDAKSLERLARDFVDPPAVRIGP